MRYKKFQKEDYARAALHNGFILAHDTGGGKTLAAFTWPLLKLGFEIRGTADASRTLHPFGSILIVSKEDLFPQFREEGQRFFGLSLTPVPSQAAFLNIAKWKDGRWIVPPGFYFSSYTQ